MPIAGALIAGVAAIGGSMMASRSASSAANRAAAAQTASDAAAIAEQRRQYDTTRGDLMPWQQAGTQALGNQGTLLGLNGADQQQAAIDQLRNSPLYASLFGNGRDAILANGAATGGLRGGNMQGALANFGRDTLAQVIQQQVANLGGVAEQGQNAASQTGAFGASSANAISSLMQDQGQAQASAALTGGAASMAATQNIVGALTGLANNRNVQQWVGRVF